MTSQTPGPAAPSTDNVWRRLGRLAVTSTVLFGSGAYIWTQNPQLLSGAPQETARAETEVDTVAAAAAPPDPTPPLATTPPAPANGVQVAAAVSTSTATNSIPGAFDFPTLEKTPTYHDGKFRGGNAYAYYGEVGVSAVIESGKLVEVVVHRYPNDRKFSKNISDKALVSLRRQALERQSANVDMVSGATWTSKGYADSLRTALQKSVKGPAKTK